jgi:hypothetical protein
MTLDYSPQRQQDRLLTFLNPLRTLLTDVKGKEIGKDLGRTEQARNTLLILATDKFGTATELQETTLENIASLERLNRMLRQVMKANSWDEILNTV